jgi:hypothetical protein
MSVEKYKPDFISGEMSKESIPFTQVCNKPLQHCTNLEALALWCHLQSRPENWVINPQQIRNHFAIGKHKVYKLLNYLMRAKLLTRTVQTCAKGTYVKTSYTLLNGSDFVNIQEDMECAHPLPGLPELAEPDLDKPPTTNKRNKQIKEKEKTKLLSASSDAPPPDDVSFDDFWKIYPVKKNKVRTKKIWDKKKYSNIATLICDDVARRKREEAQWRNPEFIPHPSTYLNNERWTDDIRQAAPSKSDGNNAFSSWMNSGNQGRDYDEHGNAIDPFSG